jgi:hypothetical protein
MPEDRRTLEFFTGKRGNKRFVLEKLDAFDEKDLLFVAKTIGKKRIKYCLGICDQEKDTELHGKLSKILLELNKK